MSRLFTVRLVKPVFQTVTLDIEAISQNSAIQKALHRVGKMSEPEWKSPQTSEEDYSIHVEAVLDHQDVYDTSANPHRNIREFQSGEGEFCRQKYMILAANLKGWVGRFLQQPWFEKIDQDSQADLCLDWIEPLKFIIENDGMESFGAQVDAELEAYDYDNVIDFPLSLPNQE